MERNPFDAVDTSNALLVEWVTISVWPFSVSRHHLLYYSKPKKVPQHCPLGMVQHFMIHATKQQCFCFISSKWGSKRQWVQRASARWVKYLLLPKVMNNINENKISRIPLLFLQDKLVFWLVNLFIKPYIYKGVEHIKKDWGVGSCLTLKH